MYTIYFIQNFLLVIVEEEEDIISIIAEVYCLEKSPNCGNDFCHFHLLLVFGHKFLKRSVIRTGWFIFKHWCVKICNLKGRNLGILSSSPLFWHHTYYRVPDGRRSLVLVVFVGGVTFAEISALRFLSAQVCLLFPVFKCLLSHSPEPPNRSIPIL